jgi:hypothetical protein
MKILRQGTNYSLHSADAEFIKGLPLGIYTVIQNPLTKQFSLMMNDISTFEMPTKIYGNCQIICDKVLKRYYERDKNLGVLLNGKKGSGKSLTAKLICNEAKLPIIILNKAYDEGDFVGFISEISQKFILFIDEFEKVYDNEHQEVLLPLLDGWGRNKILVLMTSNADNRVNYFLKNRPSRIYYKIDFKDLSLDEIGLILNDKLINKIHIDNAIKACTILGNVNMDVLNAIIEEINFNDSSNVNELFFYLNLESEAISFDFTARHLITNKTTSGIFNDFNPLDINCSFNLDFYWGGTIKNEDNKDVLDDFDEYYMYNECTNFSIIENGFKFTFKDVEFKLKKAQIKQLTYGY